MRYINPEHQTLPFLSMVPEHYTIWNVNWV